MNLVGQSTPETGGGRESDDRGAGCYHRILG